VLQEQWARQISTQHKWVCNILDIAIQNKNRGIRKCLYIPFNDSCSAGSKKHVVSVPKQAIKPVEEPRTHGDMNRVKASHLVNVPKPTKGQATTKLPAKAMLQPPKKAQPRAAPGNGKTDFEHLHT
jgi:hypothetical protein